MSDHKALVFPHAPLKNILIPFNMLPHDTTVRDSFLSKYFQGLLVDCREVKDHWNINLFWPESSEFYVDPKIQDGIEKWASNVQIADIPFCIKDYGNYQESLEDNWTLYAWSKWWKELDTRKSKHSKITIFHLDDHDDLMSPKIYINEGKLYNLLTNEPVSLSDPNSIKSAILSSAIGIGEFILPFLWEIPFEIDIRHLCERKRDDKHKHFSLELSSEPDQIHPKFQRLTVNIKPYQKNRKSRITYYVNENIDDILNIEKNGMIMLHIDLDYFNNRYDGCSRWQENKRIFDPNKDRIKISQKKIFESLKVNKLVPYIENITVSTSPGFFPAEYWDESLSFIQNFFLGEPPKLGV